LQQSPRHRLFLGTIPAPESRAALAASDIVSDARGLETLVFIRYLWEVLATG
jgi:hypothetical protein